jgi:superfamily II DNA or RNA helicase
MSLHLKITISNNITITGFRIRKPDYCKIAQITYYLEKELIIPNIGMNLFFRTKFSWTIPKGFYNKLINKLDELKISYTLNWKTNTTDFIYFDFNAKLKLYQAKAFVELKKHHFAILKSPARSGKTIIALRMIRHRKQKTLIVVHSTVLLDQWKKRVKTFLGLNNKEIGIIGDGIIKFNPNKLVTIAIVNSLNNYYNKIFPHINHLILDEVHRLSSELWLSSISKNKCAYILGLSATPYRKNKQLNKILNLFCGNIVHTIKQKDLQKSGDVMTAKLIPVKTDCYYLWPGSYSQLITKIINDPIRNTLIIKKIINFHHKNIKPSSIIISDRVEHCLTLNNLFKRKTSDSYLTTKSEILTSKTKNRKEIIANINSGKSNILFTTSQMLGEGFDEPKLSAIFIVCPFSYKGAVVQRISRILTAVKGKECFVFDFVDNCKTLQNSYQERLKTYKEIGVN